jgi:hypothetical protein
MSWRCGDTAVLVSFETPKCPVQGTFVVNPKRKRNVEKFVEIGN